MKYLFFQVGYQIDCSNEGVSNLLRPGAHTFVTAHLACRVSSSSSRSINMSNYWLSSLKLCQVVVV